MGCLMFRVVFFDLDGTLVDTAGREWEDVKYGRKYFSADDIPLKPGALQLLANLRSQGCQLWIVSDSSSAYVRKMSEHLGFGRAYLANCGKPNTIKFEAAFFNYYNYFQGDERIRLECLFVGDSHLDIQIARRLGMPSLLVDSEYKGRGRFKKAALGSTYICRCLSEVHAIVMAPISSKLVLEDPNGGMSTCISLDVKSENRKVITKGLARQLRGAGDWPQALHVYSKLHEAKRDEIYLNNLSDRLSTWLRTVCESSSGKFDWSVITWAPDKESTIPPNKMRDLVSRIDTHLAIEPLFEWKAGVDGSVRRLTSYASRVEFLKNNLFLRECVDIRGRDIVVIDDQFTTGATSQRMIDDLIEAGARNVLMVILFYIADDVLPGLKCPMCNLDVLIKTNKKTGDRFYSCAPMRFGNVVDGCGWSEDLLEA